MNNQYGCFLRVVCDKRDLETNYHTNLHNIYNTLTCLSENVRGVSHATHKSVCVRFSGTPHPQNTCDTICYIYTEY